MAGHRRHPLCALFALLLIAVIGVAIFSIVQPTAFQSLRDRLWSLAQPAISQVLPQVAGSSDQEAAADSPAVELSRGLGYDGLEEIQRTCYDELLVGLMTNAEKIRVSGSADDVTRSFWAVINDHPEFFWVDTGTVETYSNESFFIPSRTMSVEEAEALQAQVDVRVGAIVAGIPEGASTYDKVKYFYDWIIDSTEYDVYADNSQNVLSVFLGNRSVCAGYSRAFEYLCQAVGIPCTYIPGSVDGESHAWNLVVIDGTPTLVDVTWGDPLFTGGEGFADGRTRSYDYFCVTTEEMQRKHVTDPLAPAFPICDSHEYDYFRQTGTYIEPYDTDRIDELVLDALGNGLTSVQFKLDSPEALSEAKGYLEGGSLYYGPLEGYSTWSVIYNDDLYIVDFSW